MANNFLFDANIFIYYLNASAKVEKYFNEDFIMEHSIYYSVITEIELLSFSKLSKVETQDIKSLLNKFLKISLTEEIKDKTIEIRRRYKISLGDSIIAASSLINNSELITRNEEDFLKSQG